MKTYLEPEEVVLMEEKAATIRDKLATGEAGYTVSRRLAVLYKR